LVEGLTTQQDTLEELYLAHNGLTNEGVSHPTGLGLVFAALSTLDLSRNALTSTQPLAHLSSLSDLWLSGNNISTFEDVEPLSANLTNLETIYLEYNPLQQDFEYRKKVKALIPSLEQIDANRIAGDFGGGGGGQAQTLEEQMRQLQERAIQKAKEQAAQKEQTEES
jgi:Leucine-rich repeat (LRR) protein